MSRPSRGPGHRYDARTKRRARRLFKQHQWTPPAIARELEVPVDRVREWVAPLRTTEGNARRYDREAILADAATMTRAQLRTKYGCSTRYLSDLLTGKLDPTPVEPKLANP